MQCCFRFGGSSEILNLCTWIIQASIHSKRKACTHGRLYLSSVVRYFKLYCVISLPMCVSVVRYSNTFSNCFNFVDLYKFLHFLQKVRNNKLKYLQLQNTEADFCNCKYYNLYKHFCLKDMKEAFVLFEKHEEFQHMCQCL